ncbi:MAG: hypothetical protein HOC27_04310 [Phycisphaerae bacterium]|jgi:phosphoglycerate dehydrogenase-like enzyme|nr:hypothetical protein [Phycisphaerae bacterium]
MNTIVIQTENLPQECSDWLAKRCELHMCPPESLRFKELLPKANGLVIRTYTTVDRKMLEQAPNLQVVGRAGAGVDNIDLVACKENFVTVVHTPDANSESVVEFVITTMLTAIRNTVPITSSLHQKEWNTLRDTSMTQKEFSETTVGIIGFGRIGSRLGKMANSMGFRVVFNDLLDVDHTHGCKQVDMDQLLRESDVVSIHVDGRTENKHLCDNEMFEKMKPNMVFINTARGFIVDTYALTHFLTHHPSAFAILDVHDPEPITPQYPVLHIPNAILYPHIACKTKRATVNMGWVVRDIDAVLRGSKPKYPTT